MDAVRCHGALQGLCAALSNGRLLPAIGGRNTVEVKQILEGELSRFEDTDCTYQFCYNSPADNTVRRDV